MKTVKCVLVGDSGVGKTYLLLTLHTGIFPKDYIPGVQDHYAFQISVDGQIMTLSLLDTCGRPEYDRLRPLIYPASDVFLLCFSISSPQSFRNVQLHWLPEVQRHCPHAPVLLLGTKVDLRSSAQTPELGEESPVPVSQQQGYALASEIRAMGYLECSALQKEGLHDVLQEVERTVCHTHRNHRISCFIL